MIFQTRSKKFSLGLLCGLLLSASACAPHLGPTIETPDVPVSQIKSDVRARMGTYVALQSVEDARPAPSRDIDSDYTQPVGAVKEIVEAAIKTAFRDHGISVLDTSPVQMTVSIRDWRSQVKVNSSTAIDSKAVVYIELSDPTGKRIYSGTYEGSRSSQFPVVNRVDVQDSLGIAMANCISHVLDDPKILEIIGSY